MVVGTDTVVKMEALEHIDSDMINALVFDQLYLETSLLDYRVRLRDVETCQGEPWYDLMLMEAGMLLSDDPFDDVYLLTIEHKDETGTWKPVLIPDLNTDVPIMHFVETAETGRTYEAVSLILDEIGTFLLDMIVSFKETKDRYEMENETMLYVMEHGIEFRQARTGEVITAIGDQHLSIGSSILLDVTCINSKRHRTMIKVSSFLLAHTYNEVVKFANEDNDFSERVRLAISVVGLVNRLSEKKSELDQTKTYMFEGKKHFVEVRPDKLKVKIHYKEGGGHFTVEYGGIDSNIHLLDSIFRSFKLTYTKLLEELLKVTEEVKHDN